MRDFLERTFGPSDLYIIDNALRQWLVHAGISKESEEAQIAAGVALNLFREGHDTVDDLFRAMQRHRGLAGIVN